MSDFREILSKPYGWLVIPEPDGSFFAEIIEFPGCIATGKTPEEAIATLREVAVCWLDATIAQGQSIPDPQHSAEKPRTPQ